MTEVPEELREDPMARVFPKMTKCTFHKFGPSGTVEKFDGLCVLPLNIINEKIYVFLWFWFIILTVITGMQVIYRFVFTRYSRTFSGTCISIVSDFWGPEVVGSSWYQKNICTQPIQYQVSLLC